MLPVIALLYILCKYACAYFRNIDINTYSAHVYEYTLNSSHSGIKLPRYLYIHIQTTWLLYTRRIVYSYYTERQKSCTTYIFTLIFKIETVFKILKLGFTYAYNSLYFNVSPSNLSFVVLPLQLKIEKPFFSHMCSPFQT